IDKKEERLFYIKKRRGCALVLTQPLLLYINHFTSLPQNQRDISISDLRTRVANITQTQK
ncbi:hypothetical protein, partial [Bacteroides faecis]